VAAVFNGVGSGFFFPANTSAVLSNAPPDAYGVANGLLRTFSNVGMVGSFAVALLAASAAISREEAFAIFPGTSTLQGALAGAFIRGVHTALRVATIPVLIALGLSILRGSEARAGLAGDT